MSNPSVLIIVSVSLALNIINAEITSGNKMELKMLEVDKSTNRKTPSISFDKFSPMISNMEIEDSRFLQRMHVNKYDTVLRKKRQTMNMVQSNVITDLKDMNTMHLIHIGDTDVRKSTIAKRHACRHHNNRWNHLRFFNDDDIIQKEVKSQDSSEESGEVNTEDTLGYGVASTERISKKDESNEVKIKSHSESRNSDEKRIKHGSKDKNHNNDSSESADDKEFIFMNVPQTIFKNSNENKNRNNDKNKHNNRSERGVIEEEYVATTTSIFKFTSSDLDFGSNVAFRNINV